MLNKKLLLFFLAIVVAGCSGLDYSWGTRVIYEGVVTNKDGEPLRDIMVRIYADDESIYDDSEVIASAKTDQNGYFEMIFPPVKGNVTTTLLVNLDEHRRIYNDGYSNVSITNLPQEKADDYKLDFGAIRLFEVQDSTTLTVTVNNANNYFNFFYLAPAGLVDDQIIDYTAPAHPFYDFDSDSQNNTLTYVFTVAKNQLIHLSYRNEEETDFEEIAVPVNETPVAINIEY